MAKRKPLLIIISSMIVFFSIMETSLCSSSRENRMNKTPNRLINEKSPYLLQHAYNPVDWYAWGPEAFAEAARENKPIFLSIGYSTCHWCHVMERECFDDPEVAALLNATFICIKVDREERPDIDNVYMAVSQLMTRSGGWPLTIFMTPDKKPFFAGTYIPKHGRYGRIGLMELIPRVKELWETKREELLESAEGITRVLTEVTNSPSGKEMDENTLKSTFLLLSENFDSQYGGFGRNRKFPTPHNLLFLLRYWKRSGENRALEMVEKTLENMRSGGIFDHIGFGFHRYSTDPEWLLPHFEKMLYDQAMLAMAYTETYQATGKEIYKKTAMEIFTYVLRDMTSPSGGFYSAEDADSEGDEGKFYLWSVEDVYRTLDKKEADLLIRIFNLERDGNFVEQATQEKTGTNIFYLKKSFHVLADELKVSESDLRSRLEEARKKLFAVRKKRVHPLKDDKILVDWNGLMIAAFSKGAKVFGVPRYEEAARKALDFILKNMREKDGRLMHRFRKGEVGIPGYLDDYAFLIQGLLEFYDATFEAKYLLEALKLNAILLKHYRDEKNGGFYFTADDGEELLLRKKDSYDGAIPSGNSVMARNLIHLARLTANSGLEEIADKIANAFSGSVLKNPDSYTFLMCALDFALGPSYEVVIVGEPDAADSRRMLLALRERFIPNKVVLFRPTNHKAPPITRLAKFTETLSTIENKATAYVCLNYRCELPVTDVKAMLALLGVKE